MLAIFKEMNADVNLFAIIFGESIFNDAVAIVMYQTVMLSGTAADATVWESIYKGAGDFTLIFVGSLGIGAVMALLVAFVLKRQSSYVKDTVESSNANVSNLYIKQQSKQSVMTELSLMLISPYASYLVASGLRLSGICAILINGVILSSYGTPNTTRATQKISKLVYEILAYASETLVFLFLGIGLLVFRHPFRTMGWGTLFATIINLNVARFLNIFICTLIVNRFRTEQTKFSAKT